MKSKLKSRIGAPAVGSHLHFYCGLALLTLSFFQPLQAQSTITLSPATSPAAGQPGITTITVIGSNFPSGTISPSAITVTVQPAVAHAGPTATTPAAVVTTIVGSTRRVTFTIPSSIVVSSPASYLVSISGTTSTNTSFASVNQATLRVNPPASISSLSPNTGQAGQTVTVTVTGNFTNFLQRATQASFGAGISVGGGPVGGLGPLTVTSPTSAAAQLVISPSAPTGPQAVLVATGLQQASLAAGFTVLPPDPSTVAPAINSTVATTIGSSTAFLYSGVNPIQTGVAPNNIVPARAAVLRGKVLDKTNAPLPGVIITVLNHPEFGQTLSRADGVFDMAVNGGGPLTLNYAKAGFLSAQRQVQVTWQDFALVPDVILLSQDTHVTALDLTSNAPIQVARGGLVTDSDGTRQATLLFPQGTQATMVMVDGSSTLPPTLHVRATEYTVGPNGHLSMPAELPPMSAYTYAVELSCDEAVNAGATSVTFNNPIVHYTENFLRFPVGTTVPTGYYDRAKGVWVPSDSGLVVEIVKIAGSMADLDIDGTGVAANATALAALGVSDAERQQIATIYQPGQSLWRVPITHFSALDCNWPFSFPPDAKPPNGPPPPPPTPKPRPCKKGGSIIEAENQILHESVDVIGTPFRLCYTTDRVQGRTAADTLEIPLSGPNVPASLKRIDLEIDIAGEQFMKSFPGAPNQSFTFTWDRKDAYGRTIQGPQLATIKVGFVYNGVYYKTPKFNDPPNGVILTGNPTRREVTAWQIDRASIGHFDALPLGLGGWSLSINHLYALPGILYLGDGNWRAATDLGAGVITTVAGSGERGSGGFSGDGGSATRAQLKSPGGVAVGPDGSLYIADTFNNRVRHVDTNGIVTTLAGAGQAGFGGDGGPAAQAQLFQPQGVALGSDGSLYIADTGNGRVRRVNSDGIITTVAGGAFGGLGDGGQATKAQLLGPQGVAISPDGSLYIADTDNSRVRRVNSDGTITTVAGGAFGLFGGDGGPATQASLNFPIGLALSPDGSIYIADLNNNRVRRVDPDGIITTVAGTGRSGGGLGGFSGDGGPATQAICNNPRGVAMGGDGSLYIGDTLNNRVRRVDPGGIIATVAGAGQSGFGGDGGPATQALLGGPEGVAVGPDGGIYIADSFDSRVRRVISSLSGISVGDFLVPGPNDNEVYLFDSQGKHLRTFNAFTGSVRYQFSYDKAGHLTQVADADGNTTTIEYDGAGNSTGIVAPFGQRTALAVDANGYLNTITDPLGGTFRMSYTPAGLLIQFTDPNGHSSSMTYDNLGRLIHESGPAGGSATLARTDTGLSSAVSLSTALNRTTLYQVEDQTTGNERRVTTLPDGTQVERLLGTDGSLKTTLPDETVLTLLPGPDPRFSMQTSIAKSASISTGTLISTLSTERTVSLADPRNPLSLTTLIDKMTVNGRTLASSFDAATETFTDTTATGRKSMVTVDTQGRITRVQVPGLFAGVVTYDGHGRFATVTQGTGNDTRTITFSYNNAGYLQTVTDPLGRSLGFQYDASGRITRNTFPDGRETSYGYDANGNLISLTPPGRPPHNFTYTPVNLISQYIPPAVAGTGLTAQAYNADRQLTSVTRPDGKIVSLEYQCCRLSKETITRGSYTLDYNAATRNLSSITAPDGGMLTYSYNGALLANMTWKGMVAGAVSLSYDNDFGVTSLGVNGTSVNLSYDSDGLLTQAGDLTLIRDPNNGLLTGTKLGHESETFTYNGFGELTGSAASFNGTPLLAEQYSYDRLGRIVQKVETISGTTVTFIFSYDLAGRLIQVQQNGTKTAIFTYDGNGNRLDVDRTGIITSGSYDIQDRLTQYGSTAYTYTSNGELESKTFGGQTTSYSYDEFGNLLSVKLPGSVNLIEYVIDGQNRRIGKKKGGTLVQGFLYQDQFNPIAELDAANNVVSRFVYGSRSNVPDYMVKKGITYRIISDQLGSPRLIVDVTTGGIAQRIDYDEFGRVLQDSNPGFQPFGFAGGLYDRDTKLLRFGARDYDPETGRWTQKDPLRFVGGDENLYAYAGLDPVNNIDPSGLWFCEGPAYRDCNEKFFRRWYGSFVGDWLVPNFSLFSYLPSSDYFEEAWKTAAESAAVKGGGLKGIDWLAAKWGWSKVATWGSRGVIVLGVIASGVSGFATAADLAAWHDCRGCCD